jgi:hypothetical protein
LKCTDCPQGLPSEDAVDRDAQSALEAGNGGARVPELEHRALARGAQDRACPWAGDSVDREGGVRLEGTDSREGPWPEDAVDDEAERPLQLGYGRPAVAELEGLAIRAARRAGRPRS